MSKSRSKTVDAILIKNHYFQKENIKINSDPLQFRKNAEKEFFPMGEIVKKYLCIPASSVEAGEYLSAKRSRLKPSNLNKLIFLNHNKWLVD